MRLAPSSVAGVAQVVHPGSPTGPDLPPTHTAAEPDHPSATESLTPSSYLSMPPCGSHWVKNTQDQNILFPQGGEHKVLGSHQGSATWDWLGHHGQLTQPLTSNVLTHLVTRPFADSLTRSLLHSLPCSSLIHSHTQSRAHSLSVYGPHMKKEAQFYVLNKTCKTQQYTCSHRVTFQ